MKAKPTPLITIEKNIPIPALSNGGCDFGRPPKYPFLSLKLGDSFFVPGKTVTRFSPNSSQFKKVHPEFNFTSRAAIKAGVKGVRVWRIKVVKKAVKAVKK